VFPHTIGCLQEPGGFVYRHFKKVLVKAGLPDIRFHDLRHTAATILLSHGVNIKVVSEMLGHADIATTLRTYAHVIPHMQQVAVDVMDALSGRWPGTSVTGRSCCSLAQMHYSAPGTSPHGTGFAC
jgi:integrase